MSYKTGKRKKLRCKPPRDKPSDLSSSSSEGDVGAANAANAATAANAADAGKQDVEPDFVQEMVNKLHGNCSSAHTACTEIQATIIHNIREKGNIYPQHVLEAYIKFLTKRSARDDNYRYYYGHDDGCAGQPENYIEALSALIAFYPPSPSSIDLLAKAWASNAVDIIIANGYDIPTSALDVAILAVTRNYSGYGYKTATAMVDMANKLSRYDKVPVTRT